MKFVNNHISFIFDQSLVFIILDSEYEEEEEEEENSEDEEWYKTPLIRRIKKIRDTNFNKSNTSQSNKRKLGETFNSSEAAEKAEGGNDTAQPPKPKRSTSGRLGCTCRKGCKNKTCSCVKSGKGCTEACKCPEDICQNKGHGHDNNDNTEQSPEFSVLADRTNASNNTTTGTMSLLVSSSVM